MSLKSKIEKEIILSMKSKDSLRLESLRAIKSAIILWKQSLVQNLIPHKRMK